MPGEHAYFSPSASSRWIACPASLFLSEKISSTTSIYAHEGTICHAIAADCLTKNIRATDFAGKVVEKVAMTPELIDGIQLYVDEIRGLAKEYEATGGKIEHKVKLTDDCWGTSDAILWNKELIIIGDLKMGKNIVVSADNNSQMKLYSAGALMWLKKEHNIEPKKILNIIIQPRTPNPVRVWETTRKKLIIWYAEKVIPIFKNHKPGTRSPSPCNPGEVQCKWCPIAASCVAYGSKAMKDAQNAFSPFTEIKKPAIKTLKDTLNISEIVEYKKSFGFITQWMNKINEFVLQQALSGKHVPGFKLVEGRSNRIWKEKEADIVKFLEGINVEPYSKKLISPPQAEKATGKKKAKDKGMYELITKPKGAPTLALESDKREAINLHPVEEIEESFQDTLIIDDADKTEEVGNITALQRMQLAEDEDENEGAYEGEKEPQEDTQSAIESELTKTATGGNDKTIAVSVLSTITAKPPAKTTKRYQVMMRGKEGDKTISETAIILGCGGNMVRMHLRYLNERDGYSYEVYSDGTFKVY